MRAVLAVAVAGCYSPTLIDGQMCSETGHCPEGLACDPNTNTCVSNVVHCREWSDFGAPVKLANLTTGHNLYNPWLSPDKTELWYIDDGEPTHLRRSRRQIGGDFPASEPVVQPDDINTTNGQPFLSDDLLTLYYNDSAVHVTQRKRATPMDDFSLTGERVFPTSDPSDAAITADGLQMVVGFPVLSSAADLQLSTRASTADDWPAPDGTAFAAANSPGDDDCCATISGDGTEVIFESSRAGQALWRTTRSANNTSFGAAVKIVQPDNAGNASPTLSRDGTTLVYSSKPDGQSTYDIVMAERTCLQSD